MVLQSELDPELLLKETENLRNKIFEALAANEKEKSVIEVTKNTKQIRAPSTNAPTFNSKWLSRDILSTSQYWTPDKNIRG